MIDYLSRIHSIQLCTDYDDIRNCKLKELIYLADVIVSYYLTNDSRRLEKSLKDAIPEFYCITFSSCKVL